MHTLPLVTPFTLCSLLKRKASSGKTDVNLNFPHTGAGQVVLVGARITKPGLEEAQVGSEPG